MRKNYRKKAYIYHRKRDGLLSKTLECCRTANGDPTSKQAKRLLSGKEGNFDEYSNTA